MNWMQALAETYDNCQSSVGYSVHPQQRPLLPICHITTQAHVEMTIDGDGNFRRARLITDKADSVTIIPCTEGSASRSGSKPVPHPLCDKLQYVAGDFLVLGGKVTSGFAKRPQEPYLNFVDALTRWCDSPDGHAKARAILRYVTKRRLMQDLANQHLLLVGDDGKLSSKQTAKRDKSVDDIFSVINAQDDAFVRWVVETPTEAESRTWRDKTLWTSWMRYYLGSRSDRGLCYVTGQERVLTASHPKYIRREGDGAKLLSSNDTSGFTFRGRFLNDEQAAGVSFESSHKAHNALIWLISRQGYRRGDLAVVAWATSGVAVPQLTDDAWSLLYGKEETPEQPADYTAQILALQLKQRIAGYGKALGNTDHVAVLALDSATPGRLAVTYFRLLTGADFLQRIDQWHATCAWLHRYRTLAVQQENGKIIRKQAIFVGAPSPNDIAEAAYGSRLDDKLRKAAIERILPCIIDGQPLPRDLAEATIRRASNRIALEQWEWNKTLSIACALFRKLSTKETYDMALDASRRTRDYLYGRALALADSLEQWALNEADEGRQTTAARLMQRFAQRPYSTWRTIELALVPYKARLGDKSWRRQQMIDEVIAAFEPDDFISDKPLSGEFLLGYHSQREALRASRSASSSDANSDSE